MSEVNLEVQLMDGNVTIALVIICFAVASVAVGATLWMIAKFQTKVEGRELERRLREETKAARDAFESSISDIKVDLDKEVKKLEGKVDDVHKHMHTMRSENREDSKRLQATLDEMRRESTQQAKETIYIRGLLEPRPALK